MVGILSDVLRPTLGTDSLRVAMVAVGSLAVWGAVHFYLSSRHMREGLAQARQG